MFDRGHVLAGGLGTVQGLVRAVDHEVGGVVRLEEGNAETDRHGNTGIAKLKTTGGDALADAFGNGTGRVSEIRLKQNDELFAAVPATSVALNTWQARK
ncbi:MAG: hypothetical protein PHS88_11540 [Candidatus Omnitrophica bacterium]|nr:hypothetical protein [Candidatus Omnitrophota bacterium]